MRGVESGAGYAGVATMVQGGCGPADQAPGAYSKNAHPRIVKSGFITVIAREGMDFFLPLLQSLQP